MRLKHLLLISSVLASVSTATPEAFALQQAGETVAWCGKCGARGSSAQIYQHMKT